jgi:hypothetical protein
MPGAGSAPIWAIDHTTLVNNDRLAAVPADRTQLCRVDTGECYLVAGGAPIQVPAADIALVPGWNPKASTVVSGAEFRSWTRLRSTPADGSFLCDTTTTTCYSTAGGAALTLPAVDAARMPGWSSSRVVRVSHYEFAHHAHLRRYPRDGTKICPLDDTSCYVVAGRAPLPISAAAAASVPALKTAGAPRISSYEMRRPTNLAVRPVDGTLLQTASVKGVYVVSAGAASFSATTPSNAVSAAPVVVDQAAIDNAGLTGRWAHLLSNPAVMALTSPTLPATTSGRVSVTWATPVASSAVTSYAVRMLVATPTTGATPWVVPAQWKALTATSASRAVAPGQTLCLSVRATNRAGQVGPWSPARCTARALDQTAATTVTRGWRVTTSPKLYLGSALTTTTRLASWTLASVTTDRVGIVASRCATCGSVNIFIGHTLVGAIDLQAATTSYQQLIMLPRFATRTGPLTLVVRSAAGRTVQLDGVVASKT